MMRLTLLPACSVCGGCPVLQGILGAVQMNCSTCSSSLLSSRSALLHRFNPGFTGHLLKAPEAEDAALGGVGERTG